MTSKFESDMWINLMLLLLLLPIDKTADDYEKVFRSIKDYMLEQGMRWSPRIHLTDFEKAITIGVKRVWPEIEAKHCLFHLMQSLERKAKEIGTSLGISLNGPEGDLLGLDAHRPGALAYLPDLDISNAFDAVYSSLSATGKVLADWFKDIYIGTDSKPPR